MLICGRRYCSGSNYILEGEAALGSMTASQDAGSTGGTFVYKKRALLPAIASLVSFAALTLIVFAKAARYAGVILPVALIFGGVPIVLEFRRSIRISVAGFDYTWRSGKTVHIDIAQIARVEQEKTLYWLSVARPTVVPAVGIILKSGEKRIFPLDFPCRDEIVGRLRGLVALSNGTGHPSG